MTDQFAYMPYGYAKHTGTTDTPFQWLGGYGVYYDADTQLHLTLYRAYSCDLKRFMQADPLGIDGGSNVYEYCFGNPLYFVDPDGRCGVENRLEFNMPGYGDVQSYQISGGHVRDLTVNDFEVAAYLYGNAAVMAAEGSSAGDIMTLMDPDAGLGWKALALLSLALDAGGIGQIPGTSIGVPRRIIKGSVDAIDVGQGITKSSRKRLKRLVNNLSQTDNVGLSQQKLDQLRGIVDKTGANVRVDLDGVKGTGVRPHAQIEGMGSKVESRHIWLQEGVY